METFTEIVAREKEERSLSYRRFAEIAKVSHTYIRDIVINKVVPTEEVVVALAQALGYDPVRMLLLARREKATREDVIEVYNSIDRRLDSGERPEVGESGSSPRLAKVPVFDAQAGQPASWTDGGYPVGYSNAYEYLPTGLVDENSFCVRIHGDSMEPGLKEGDLALVNPSGALVNGKLCFASFPGEDGDRMVKRYYKYGETIVLRSDNDSYPEITLSAEDAPDVRIYRVTRSIRQE